MGTHVILWLWACSGDPTPPAPVAEPVPPAAARAGTVVVEVDLSAPEQHRVRVRATVETGGAAEVAFEMPVWTPGSYLVREYARNVEAARGIAPDGRALSVTKTAKNRWVVAADGATAVTLETVIYAKELTVRSAFVDSDLAVLVGAGLFMQPEHLPEAAWDVSLTLPPTWSRSVTALSPHADGVLHHYVAGSFDELVDSPIVVGNPSVGRFEVSGVGHEVAHFLDAGEWDLTATLGEVEKITAETIALWGSVPYDRYVFLNVVGEAGGGLEHENSSLLMSRRQQGRDPDAHRRWLGLVSHELFHAWNVKRLRPSTLGDFDYNREHYSPSLWIAEGWTSYYDDLLLVRAGLITQEDHLKRLGETVGALQRRPGRLVQPLGDAGFDAWIKHYRPDESADNSRVDYYVKGALAAWIMDAEIRRRTDGARSLDDVLRLAWTRFPANRGYTEAEMRALISEVAGADLGPWLAELVDSPTELDYSGALSWFGLRFPVEAADDEPKAWLGLDAGSKVARVLRDTPAWDAGVNAGDELIALDGVRIESDVEALLAGRTPGETAELIVARRGRLRTLPVVFGTKPTRAWTLEVDPGALAVTRARRLAWWASSQP